MHDGTGDDLTERSTDADAVPMTPSVKLKRPEPRVRSAITNTETMPKMQPDTPSRISIATSAAGLAASV